MWSAKKLVGVQQVCPLSALPSNAVQCAWVGDIEVRTCYTSYTSYMSWVLELHLQQMESEEGEDPGHLPDLVVYVNLGCIQTSVSFCM